MSENRSTQTAVGVWAASGTALGAAFGAAFGDVAISVGLGAAIGAAIGAMMSKRPKETAIKTTPNNPVAAVGAARCR